MARENLFWNSVQCVSDISDTIHNTPEYQETIGRLLLGEYRALHLEKLHNYDNIYSMRVKGNKNSDRLLFTYRPEDKTALILSVADNHRYDKAAPEAGRIRNRLDEIEFEDALLDGVNNVVPDNDNLLDDLPARADDLFGHVVQYNEHLITLSSQQYQASITLPLIINGIAGSGKTLVAQDVLMSVEDEEAGVEERISYYFAPTKDLIKTMTQSIEALPNGKSLMEQGKVVITTFEDYAKTQLEIAGEDKTVVGSNEFQDWCRNSNKTKAADFNKHRKSLGRDCTDEQIYSEICRASTYEKDEYVKLGRNQSIFAGPLTETIWKIKKLYNTELNQKNNFDPNIQSLPIAQGAVENVVDQDRFWQWYGDYDKSNQEEVDSEDRIIEPIEDNSADAQGANPVDQDEVHLEELGTRKNIYDLVCSAYVDEKDKPVILEEQKNAWQELSRKEQAAIRKVRQDYLQDLADSNAQDELLMRVVPKKNRVVVDEFQSASPLLLQTAKDLSSQNAVIYMGDHAQSIVSSVSNIAIVRKQFGQVPIGEETWLHSYRCPTVVMEAASKLLDLKQQWTGEKKVQKDEPKAAGIEAQQEGAADEKEGNLYCYRGKSVPEIANIIKGNRSAHNVIIVPDDEVIRDEAKERFGTGMVVTPAEYIGMESHNVVMYRCFEKKATEDLVSKVNPANESHKTSINELFVAMTRETESLTICETRADKNEALFDRLGFLGLNNGTANETFASSVSEEEKELIARVKDLIAREEYNSAMNLIKGLDEDESSKNNELFSKINEFIEKGEYGVTHSIILYNICDGEEKGADMLMKKLLGIEEEVAQTTEASSSTLEPLKKKKRSKQGKNKENEKPDQLQANEEARQQRIAEARAEQERLYQEKQAEERVSLLRKEEQEREEARRNQPVMDRVVNWGREQLGWDEDTQRRNRHNKGKKNKGWFTSRASQALVGFLAVAGAGAATYISGIFGQNKVNDYGSHGIDPRIETPDDIFEKLNCKIDNPNCNSLVVYASGHTGDGSEKSVKLLQRFGELDYDLNKPLTSGGATATHIAASVGNVEAIKVLYGNVDLGAKDLNGYTPVYHAAHSTQMEVLQTLLDLGYDFKNDIESFINVVKNSNTEVIDMMIQHVDLNLLDKTGYSVSHIVTKMNNPVLLERLIKAGADPDLISEDGFSLIDVAIEVGNPELLEVLRENGATTNQEKNNVGGKATEKKPTTKPTKTKKVPIEKGKKSDGYYHG